MAKLLDPVSSNKTPTSIAKAATVAPISYAATSPYAKNPVTTAATVSSPAPAAAPSILSGGGGGGGGGAAAPAAVVAKPSLDDYIKSNFLYTSTDAQNQRQLDDFDAQTLKGEQDTEATQALKQQQLQQNLDDAGQANAEDLAGRGLLRSGITFQNQDKINQEGATQQNAIAQLLTDFDSQRQTGRATQLTANQAALNAQIAALTQQFNGTQAIS